MQQAVPAAVVLAAGMRTLTSGVAVDEGWAATSAAALVTRRSLALDEVQG